MNRAPVIVDFFVMDDVGEPFICGINGACTIDELRDIEKEFGETYHDIDCHQDGKYKIKCSWFPGQFGEYGRCELAPGWEFELMKFDASPTESDIETD